jgi:hypothetical protein
MKEKLESKKGKTAKSIQNRHKFIFIDKQKIGGENDWVQNHCQILFRKGV